MREGGAERHDDKKDSRDHEAGRGQREETGVHTVTTTHHYRWLTCWDHGELRYRHFRLLVAGHGPWSWSHAGEGSGERSGEAKVVEYEHVGTNKCHRFC
mmetsp:Transcript_33954/g.68398  ORF Transcript_33954/g.68398 Transcript_33954/m.68398 type:complete len:99 (+) Transcript_33954:1900-2196(+)